MKTIDDILKQKTWVRTLIYALAVLFFALLIFQAGMFAGYRKASFTYGNNAAFYRVFDRDAPGPHGGFIEGHGAAGKIVSINLPTFILESPDNVEKTVLITDDTDIRRFREEATPSDLTKDDFVVVIGEPDENAQIKAQLIRIMPPPQQ